MEKFYCCQCRLALTEERERLICRNCLAEYPIKDGIPFFTSGDYYFPDICESDMETLLEIAQTQGWKTGLHDFLRQRDESAYGIAGDESRADWRFLFNLSQESRVLDLGCGFGGIAAALAQRAGEVIAMDCSLKRLKLLAIRVKQENINNIFPVCGGDAGPLPFPDGYFDLIVLNGVLEWLGIFQPELNPREAQLAKLRDLRRLLKPAGSIYIGVENRIGYVYFLGGRDHNGLRFTTLLPRKIADSYTRILTGRTYRTYTYSLSGYKKLLTEAGFFKIDIYATIPTYRDVFFLINADDRKTMEYFFSYLLRTASLKRKIIALCSRVLLKAGLFRFLIPEYGIVAKE